MDKDAILLDEMYLQKEVQYHQGQLLGTDQDGNLYKGIVTFMIVGLRKNIPFVVRAVPESKIEGKWLSQHIDECLKSLHQVGFEVHAVISDNHATNNQSLVSLATHSQSRLNSFQTVKTLFLHCFTCTSRLHLFSRLCPILGRRLAPNNDTQ